MAFKKGNKLGFVKGEAPGRPKGSSNLVNRTIKETVLAVFNELQSDPKANLITWGKANPGMFYQIAAKLIPTEISGKVQTTIKVVYE